MPEIGICLEILNNMAINRFGKISICVRFDPKGLGIIGDATVDPLLDIWNGPKRKEWLQYHIQGRRKKYYFVVIAIFGEYPRGLDELVGVV